MGTGLTLDQAWSWFEELARRGQPVETLGPQRKRHRLRVYDDRVSFTSEAGTTASVDRFTVGDILDEMNAAGSIDRETLASFLAGKQRPAALMGLLALLPPIEYGGGTGRPGERGAPHPSPPPQGEGATAAGSRMLRLHLSDRMHPLGVTQRHEKAAAGRI